MYKTRLTYNSVHLRWNITKNMTVVCEKYEWGVRGLTGGTTDVFRPLVFCKFEQITICYKNRKSCIASNCLKGFQFLFPAAPVQRQPLAHGVNPCPTSLPSIDGRTAKTILGNIIFRLTVKSYLMSQVPSSLKSMKT